MASEIGLIERQVREHGYQIAVDVKATGEAVVQLSATQGNLKFTAASGDQHGPNRYEVALGLATLRMLDYEYRSKPNERPLLGKPS